MRPVCIAVIGLLLAATASGRNADGSLGIVRTPNNGVPALVTMGDTFTVEASQEARLHLVAQDGTQLPIDATWAMQRGKAQATCSLPAGIVPGTYGIDASVPGTFDRTARAVYVFEETPSYYVVAHLSDTHVGSNRHPRPAAEIFHDLIAAVNKSEAAFALITGDLTESGAPEEFRAFLQVLDRCTKPTFVVPGNHDRQALHYERTFGPLTYRFRFGEDGFLAFDTKDYLMADELGAQDADLQCFRRELKPCRWTLGLTHRYVQMMGMRAQLTLLVDNPLDALFFGHYHSAEAPPIALMPWGRTRPILTPAAVDGFMRYVDMTAKGALPREPEQVAPTE